MEKETQKCHPAAEENIGRKKGNLGNVLKGTYRMNDS